MATVKSWMARCGSPVAAKKTAARQVVLPAARLRLDGLVEIGLRLLPVAGGLVIAAARPPRRRVGAIRLDCLGIGGDRLGAPPRGVGLAATLERRQGSLL